MRAWAFTVSHMLSSTGCESMGTQMRNKWLDAKFVSHLLTETSANYFSAKTYSKVNKSFKCFQNAQTLCLNIQCRLCNITALSSFNSLGHI